MVNGSVVRPTEIMSERETMESLRDGLLKAASAARELAGEINSSEWLNVAGTLDAMSIGAQKLSDMKAMSRFETLMASSLKANPKIFLN